MLPEIPGNKKMATGVIILTLFSSFSSDFFEPGTVVRIRYFILGVLTTFLIFLLVKSIKEKTLTKTKIAFMVFYLALGVFLFFFGTKKFL